MKSLNNFLQINTNSIKTYLVVAEIAFHNLVIPCILGKNAVLSIHEKSSKLKLPPT